MNRPSPSLLTALLLVLLHAPAGAQAPTPEAGTPAHPESVALAQLHQAARAGNRLAQYRYARALLDGRARLPPASHPLSPTAQNEQTTLAAWRWMRRAATAGLPQAQYALASWYQRGEGVRMHLGTARAWYERAAWQGHADAQYALGRMLLGEARDADTLARARRWLELAASAGHAPAQQALLQDTR